MIGSLLDSGIFIINANAIVDKLLSLLPSSWPKSPSWSHGLPDRPVRVILCHNQLSSFHLQRQTDQGLEDGDIPPPLRKCRIWKGDCNKDNDRADDQARVHAGSGEVVVLMPPPAPATDVVVEKQTDSGPCEEVQRSSSGIGISLSYELDCARNDWELTVVASPLHRAC